MMWQVERTFSVRRCPRRRRRVVYSSAGETLCGRVITTLKSQASLNESVGAGYVERNWRPCLKESGACAMASLRQSFLDGSLSVAVKTGVTQSFQTDLQEILDHLWPADRVEIEPTRGMNP